MHLQSLPTTTSSRLTREWRQQRPTCQFVRRRASAAAQPDGGESDASSSSSNNDETYDPRLAAGFQPPPGEAPLWWVERFEARRRALALKQQQQQPESAKTSAATTLLKSFVMLAAAVAALILWPAALTTNGLAKPRVWALAAAYFAFFAGGTLARTTKHGALAPASADAQRASAGGRLALAAFIASMPLLHWLPMQAFLSASSSPQSSSLTLYDALGAALIAGAACVNWCATAALGGAYDRVVQPAALVTTAWPYSALRHPIYASYALLFIGYALALHSAGGALVAGVMCAAYYAQRVALEEAMLRGGALGAEYEAYSARTRWRLVPGVF